MSTGQRRLLIEPAHQRLSIAAQCRLLSISRSSYYYVPVPQGEETLALMRVIDETFMDCPWYGSRQMARHLQRLGHAVSRRRVRRLMAQMGLVAIYQRPRTSDPHPVSTGTEDSAKVGSPAISVQVSCHDTRPEQVEASPAVHGTLDQLELVDLAFDRSSAPRQNQCGAHRINIAPEAARERSEGASKCLGEPWLELYGVASDQYGVETPRKVGSIRDYGRGDAYGINEPRIVLAECIGGRGEKPDRLSRGWCFPAWVSDRWRCRR
jgi:hypothetical protein